MSEIYVVVPKGYQPPPAHTSWQGASLELLGVDQDKYEVANTELIEED